MPAMVSSDARCDSEVIAEEGAVFSPMPESGPAPISGRVPKSLQRDLWQQYYATRSIGARRALLMCYIDLIRFVAVKVGARLPGCVDVNDLVQEGYLGLDKAIDAFDPDRGVQFTTFAAKRIWGAMMDGLRGEDWQRRTDRRRTQRLDVARRELATETGRPATEEEVSDRLGISREEFTDLWQDVRTRTVRSLWSGRDIGEGRESLPVDARCEDPARAAQRHDVQALLVRGFSRAERLIVMLYYYEDMTMKEIGQTLDISESRVSQMHSLIVRRIRAALRGKRGELE